MLIFIRLGSRQKFMRYPALLLSIACLLSACGLKGPLYLPEQKPGAKPPANTVPAINAGSASAPDDKKSPGTAAP
jgi:predicted small lipoprotein YifL